MNRHLMTLLCCTLLAISCKQNNTPKQTQQEDWQAEQETNFDETDSNVLLDSLASYFRTQYPPMPQELIRKYGQPVGIDSFKTQNVHTGKDEDKVYKLFYPGKTIVLYYATELKQYFLELVELKNIQELSPFGITSRTTPENLRQLLGQEQAHHFSPELGTLYQYTLSRDVDENFLFFFQNESLTLVQYQPYLD